MAVGRPVAAFGQPTEIVLGGAAGWQDFVLRTAAISIQAGRRNQPELRIADAVLQPDDTTDVLLNFDNPIDQEFLGDYRLVEGDALVEPGLQRFGNAAGLFQQENAGITLAAGPGSIFQAGGDLGSFSIEFWMQPVSLLEGEVLIRWAGSVWINDRIVPQEFAVTIEGRRVRWEMRNLFFAFDGEDPTLPVPRSLSLTGIRGLVPRLWQHHSLRYDADTGLVEYRVDSVPEAVTHATTNTRESGDPLVGRFGEVSDNLLTIGSDFTGFLDEFRIARGVTPPPPRGRLSPQTAVFESQPIDLGYWNSTLTAIQAAYQQPPETDVLFFYRVANAVGGWPLELADASIEDREWQQFAPGRPLTATGRYVQIRVELYADGRLATGPTISELRLQFQGALPPPAPGFVNAVAENGAVLVSWSPVNLPDITGYLLYFGDQPGRYFGVTNAGAASPINVGNVSEFRITGLENGVRYYFAVSAYNDGNDPEIDVTAARAISREASARPLRVH